jgi:hypothetical protein
MIVNLNLQNKAGQYLYKNVLTGKINPICQQVFQPSERHVRRINTGQAKVVPASTKIATFTASSRKH